MEVLDSVDLDGIPEQGARRPVDPLPLDLVRLEALQPHWQQRLRERARLLA